MRNGMRNEGKMLNSFIKENLFASPALTINPNMIKGKAK